MYTNLFRKAEEQLLGAELSRGLATVAYLYTQLEDRHVPEWAERERCGYSGHEADPLPDCRVEDIGYFNGVVMYEVQGYGPRQREFLLPPSVVPENARKHRWCEPIGELERIVHATRTGGEYSQWDMRFLLNEATRYLQQRPLFAPHVRVRVENVVGYTDPSRPEMIVERVRSQALRLLTAIKPLLRLPDEEAQGWTVQVNNQLTNIALNSVISGQVQQQVNINRLADELGRLRFRRPSVKRSALRPKRLVLLPLLGNWCSGY